MASLEEPACTEDIHDTAAAPTSLFANYGRQGKPPTPKFHIILIARGKFLSGQQVRGRALCSPPPFSSTTDALSSFRGANGAAASYTAALHPFPIWLPMA